MITVDASLVTHKTLAEQRRSWNARYVAKHKAVIQEKQAEYRRRPEVRERRRLQKIEYRRLAAAAKTLKGAELAKAREERKRVESEEQKQRAEARRAQAAFNKTPEARRQQWQDYASANAAALRERYRLKNLKRNIELPDYRVREKLVRGTTLRPSDIPTDMVEVQRLHLLIARKLKGAHVP